MEEIKEFDVKPLNDERKEILLKLKTSSQDSEFMYRLEKIKNYMFDYISLVYSPLINPLHQKLNPLIHKIVAFTKVIDLINNKLKTLSFNEFTEFYFDDSMELVIKKIKSRPEYIIFDKNNDPLKVPEAQYNTHRGNKTIIAKPTITLHFSDLTTTQKKQLNALLKHTLLKEFITIKEGNTRNER